MTGSHPAGGPVRPPTAATPTAGPKPEFQRHKAPDALPDITRKMPPGRPQGPFRAPARVPAKPKGNQRKENIDHAGNHMVASVSNDQEVQELVNTGDIGWSQLDAREFKAD